MSEIFGNGIMGGGGLTNSKLALADAQPEDVRSGKKFYSGDKQIKTGTNPDVAQATPTITVDTAGKITAAATQTAGIVPAGTKSATKQLTIQAGKTVTPSISAQTAVASQRFTTGDVKVAAVNGIIRVTYPAGDTCTCKNGSTTLTANASDGITVFIVPNTGTWTLTVTNGTKTATKTVSITATSRFANVTLAYFSATIKVTYPAKSKCVIKNSSGTQVASNTNTETAAKTWTATVDATGTYTITATATDGSGKTDSTTVSITTNGQTASATLGYDFIIYSGDTKSWNGGYQLTSLNSSWGGATIQNDEYPPYFGGNTGKGGRLNKVINLSGYSQLVIDCEYTGSQWYAYGLIPSSGAWAESNWVQSPGTDGMTVSSSGSSAFERKIQAFDISKLTGDYVFKGEYYSDSNAQFRIYDFRLKR